MKVLVNGTEIFVGTGSAPWRDAQHTLVLQHGAGMDRTIWVLLARYFARHGYNVVASDLPGHGASQGDALKSIEAQGEHLWDLLDQLRKQHELPPGKVVFGGHSMGSLACIEASARRVQEVDQLILFGAGYPMPVGPALLGAAKADSQSAVDMIAVYSHCFASQLGHNAVAGISVQNSAMALLERSRPGVLHTDLMACNDYSGAEAAASNLKGTPCTLIAGRQDQMTPLKAARYLAGQLDAELKVLDNCGHMMMSEQPEATLQQTRQLLLN